MNINLRDNIDEQAKMEAVVEDFKFITSTMQVIVKKPILDWSKASASFGNPDANSITFTDGKGIQKIVTAKQSMSFDMCNSPNQATSTGLFCSFVKYDSKTNSVVIQEDVERNF